MGTLPLWGALLGLVLVAVVLCLGHQAIDAIVLQGALTICEIPCGCALMSIEAGRCRPEAPKSSLLSPSKPFLNFVGLQHEHKSTLYFNMPSNVSTTMPNSTLLNLAHRCC